jgi:hypothetical protein
MARPAVTPRNLKPKEPVFILAPNGSKGSVLAAALGRHPRLFAAPHLNMLAFQTARQLLRFAKSPRDIHSHGLLRLLSSLLVAEQSIEGIQAARRWLARHGKIETPAVYRMLTTWLHPKRLVEYSPLYTYHRRVLERAVAAAPNATFIHLVRHPTATAIELAHAAAQTVDAVVGRFTNEDHNEPCLDIIELVDNAIVWQDEPVFDPQFLWYRAHSSIAAVLADLPRSRVMRVRTEDLLADPAETLASICRRLRLPVTSEVLTDMLRIKDDVFARPGPFGASRGSDWDLTVASTFPQPDPPASLRGSLPWRTDGLGYRPEVIELAEQFGYHAGGGLTPPALRFKPISPGAALSNHALVPQ